MGSLTVGVYDLLDYTTPVVLSTRDFGTSVPNTTTVARVLLDGDVVSGDRSGNRAISLTVWIDTGSRSGDAQAQSDLFAVVDQQKWSMTWTPEPGMTPVAFDCWRGTLTPTWDSVQESGGRFVVLEFAAEPFTREAAPTILAPPATPPAATTLAALDATTGLSSNPVWTNPYMDAVAGWQDTASGPGGPSQIPFILPDPAAPSGDLVAAALTVDTGSHVSGTGAVLVQQPVVQVLGTEQYLGEGQFQFNGLFFAPFTLAMPFTGSPVNMSAVTLQWYARSDRDVAGRGASAAGYDLTTVGIDPSVADAAGVSPSLVNGTWVARLVDVSGNSGSWILQSAPGTGWSLYTLDLRVPPLVADTGFDLTKVASGRLRCYTVTSSTLASSATLATPQLYPLPGSSTNPVAVTNLLNCTVLTGYNTGSRVPIGVTAAGTAETSWGTTVPVTAASTYSGRAALWEFAGHGSGVTYQAGIEWLNSSNTVLSVSWGTAVAATPAYSWDPTGHWMAQPTVAAVTAPTGAAKARIRWRILGGAATFAVQVWAPMIVPGAVATRSPYGSVPVAQLWVDQVQARPAIGGVVLTTPYGSAPFPNIRGAARTPVALKASITVPSALSRVLIGRVPQPPPRFTPFLDAATSGTVFAQAGHLASAGPYLVGTVAGSPPAVVYTIPANAYEGMYALQARVYIQIGGAVPPGTHYGMSVTADQTGDPLAVDQTLTAANMETLLTGGVSGWVWVDMGRLALPNRAVDPANTNQMVTLTCAATAAGTPLLDMMVLIPLEAPAEWMLITGVNATRLWLDTPDSDQYTGTVYAGTSDTRTDAVSCGLAQRGNAVLHFEPGNNLIYVLTDGGTASTWSVTYSPRWPGEAPPS